MGHWGGGTGCSAACLLPVPAWLAVGVCGDSDGPPPSASMLSQQRGLDVCCMQPHSEADSLWLTSTLPHFQVALHYAARCGNSPAIHALLGECVPNRRCRQAALHAMQPSHVSLHAAAAACSPRPTLWPNPTSPLAKPALPHPFPSPIPQVLEWIRHISTRRVTPRLT